MKSDKDIRRNLLFTALVVTLFLFATIFLIGSMFNSSRETFIDTQFDRMYQDFNSMQILTLLSENYDDSMACIAFQSKLKELDSYLWDLGIRIDRYRSASEEFQKDEYYLKQKKIFNDNELYYYLLMRSMINKCNLSKDILLYFYRNSADCRKCDDQSFILSDISLLDDKDNNKEIAIFSFDMDLNIPTLEILKEYYEIQDFPCIVHDDIPYCGIQDKSFLMDKVCDGKETLDVCKRYYSK